MLISTSNAPTPLALFNNTGALNNKQPVSADAVGRAPLDSQDNPPAAPNARGNLPRFKRSEPLMSSLVEQGISKRGPLLHCFQDDLINGIKKHFREYAAGENDRFVNFNELKEAAGQIPTTRAFSAEATLYAKILLQNPRVLRELDIGIGDHGRPGAEDGRFDIENIEHMLTKPTYMGEHFAILLDYRLT
ncbi:hypothetical protein [Pseudomonas sp. GZJR-8]|uniref:hypothetical protein n=1 Tax=Pseudomonas sp. GZJR-8 TaxID=1395925 RepID=UPI0015AF56B9|nr:hypothetical protein [Pseudomonas sp. GZJR-8]